MDVVFANANGRSIANREAWKDYTAMLVSSRVNHL